MRPAPRRAFFLRFRRSAACVLAITTVFVFGAPSWAARPTAMKLFPEETLLFVRMANAHEFGEKFQQTAMGRMLHDPQLKPFVDHLYGNLGNAYSEKLEGKLGITWDDLKKLPQGEVAFGVIAGNRYPGFLLMIDQGTEASVADKLVDKALDAAEKAGGEFSTEKIGDVTITVVRDHDRHNRMFGVFERENTIVVGTDPNMLKNVLWHWDHPIGSGANAETPAATGDTKAGDKSDTDQKDKSSKSDEEEFVPTRTLAENTHFATILRECRRKQDPPPNLIFFVDPVSFAKNVGRSNSGIQFTLSMMPVLGIDGIAGIGGTVAYSTEQYDDLAQIHILLDNPRSGVLQLPAFEAGDTTPQPFIPKDIESYMAFHWNLRATYDRLLALVDRVGVKSTLEKFVQEKISDVLGIDAPKQIIDNLGGRYTTITGFDKPAKLRGQQRLLAAELKDEKAAAESFKTVREKHPEIFEERHFGNITYYAMFAKQMKEKAAERPDPDDGPPYTPCVAIMDGYLLIGTSTQQLENCISAKEGTVERLVDSEDYVRTNAVIGKETEGNTPVLFAMQRAEEAIRQWYELLTSPKTRDKLNELKEKNKFFAALAETLESQQLPPFEVLAPYFSPGGGILYDTDSGYHGISFTLRGKAER